MYFVEILGFLFVVTFTLVILSVYSFFQGKKYLCSIGKTDDDNNAIYRALMVMFAVLLVGALFHRYYFGQTMRLATSRS